MSARSRKLISIIFGFLILAVLVGLISPRCGHTRIMPEMRAKGAMKQAYQIHQALYAAAQDSPDGAFPSKNPDGTPFQNSNEAFRELFVRGLIDDERLFYVQGSAWHTGKKTDGNIGDASTGFKPAVAKNENHWSYVSGLNSKTSPPETPIVLDGCSEMVGKWSDNASKKGGVWKGKFLIVVRVGGNARVYDLDEDLPKKILDEINAVPGAKLLNPDG